MTLTPGLRKLALAVHLTSSVGWIGTVAAFLSLAVAGVTSDEPSIVRAACLMMGMTISCVIVPFSFAALLTGLVSALGTHWGLFRHYWVLVKLVLTVVAIGVLLVQIEPIRALAEAASDPRTTSIAGTKRPLIHAAGGLAVLLLVQALGIYKPPGLTRYGWRKAALESRK